MQSTSTMIVAATLCIALVGCTRDTAAADRDDLWCLASYSMKLATVGDGAQIQAPLVASFMYRVGRMEGRHPNGISQATLKHVSGPKTEQLDEAVEKCAATDSRRRDDSSAQLMAALKGIAP